MHRSSIQRNLHVCTTPLLTFNITTRLSSVWSTFTKSRYKTERLRLNVRQRYALIQLAMNSKLKLSINKQLATTSLSTVNLSNVCLVQVQTILCSTIHPASFFFSEYWSVIRGSLKKLNYNFINVQISLSHKSQEEMFTYFLLFSGVKASHSSGFLVT